MKSFKNKKIIYILGLSVITLLAIIISPTYAKFIDSYVSDDTVAQMDLSFDVGITGIDEYHEVVVEKNDTLKFNVQIDNAGDTTTYYGVWYKMVVPGELPDDDSIQIGRLDGTLVSTSGEIESNGSKTVTVGIINDSANKIKLYIGVASSTTSTSDIEYLNGKYLVNNIVKIESNESSNTNANAPNLDDGGLIPVYYDESADAWKKADSTNVDNSWYDYDNKMWANAVMISDNTKRSTYQTADVGTVVSDSDISAFMVWIPRFKYRVWNINRQAGDETTYAYSAYTKGIDIEWESGVDSTGNVTCTYDVTNSTPETVLSDVCVYNDTDTITPESVNSNYQDAWYTHPAFNFVGLEKTGFWIGKFETTGSSDVPTVLPDVESFSTSSKNDFFDINFSAAREFQNYGLSESVTAHMLTNLEWGAMTYLTHSIYGLCDGTSCRDAYINNSRDNYTGRSAGVLASNATLSTNGTYDYKGYTIGDSSIARDESKVASNTGNITGIYDIVGSNVELVAAIDNSIELSLEPFYNIYSSSEDGYTFNRSMLGDAIAEAMFEESSWVPGAEVTSGGLYLFDSVLEPYLIRDVGGSSFEVNSYSGFWAAPSSFRLAIS